jgi:hypothetical protein
MIEMPSWENRFAMTVDQACWVRQMRVDEERTWRWIAEECAEAWAGDWGSERWTGKEICERAAAVLGEDGTREPWNG